MTHKHLILAAGTALALAPTAVAQLTTHASVEGSFDPTGLSTVFPFATVEAARDRNADLRTQGQGGTVQLQTGWYPETLTLDTRALYVANGGPVVIGDLGQSSTSFSLATYNAHLYGDALPEDILDALVGVNFPFIGVLLADHLHWRENLRTQYISQRLVASNVDVVAYQELWSPTLYANLRTLGAGHFTHSFYGSEVDLEGLPDCIPVPPGFFPTLCWEPLLNSGLAVFSKHPITYTYQGIFAAESGAADSFEPFATKGYTVTEIEKDGFTIAVFNTHAQSGPETHPGVHSARWVQMQQLFYHLVAYQANRPSNPIFVVGDFNIRGSGNPNAEYSTTLKALFGSIGMVDAARADYANLADNAVTSAAANRLAQHFDQNHNTDSRLDYVLYTPITPDGSTRVVLDWVDTPKHRAPAPMTEDGFSTVELSDHWAVHAGFRICRK